MANDTNEASEPSEAAILGDEHLRWLVENRSRNQRATLDLYLLLKNHGSRIDTNAVYAFELQELAGIAFSLWRAVFLSEPRDAENALIEDVSTFLRKLISNNAIGYPQDLEARAWTFPYYLQNARLRLQAMASREPFLIEIPDIYVEAQSPNHDWLIAQQALEKAVIRLGNLLGA